MLSNDKIYNNIDYCLQLINLQRKKQQQEILRWYSLECQIGKAKGYLKKSFKDGKIPPLTVLSKIATLLGVTLDGLLTIDFSSDTDNLHLLVDKMILMTDNKRIQWSDQCEKPFDIVDDGDARWDASFWFKSDIPNWGEASLAVDTERAEYRLLICGEIACSDKQVSNLSILYDSIRNQLYGQYYIDADLTQKIDGFLDRNHLNPDFGIIVLKPDGPYEEDF